MLIEWVKWRTELERRACQHWVNEADKEIARYKLLILAVDARKIIIQSLERKESQEELNKWLAKQLKITVEQADFIYSLKVRQLRALEKTKLLDELKQVEKVRSDLLARKAKPEKHMVTQLADFTAFTKD